MSRGKKNDDFNANAAQTPLFSLNQRFWRIILALIGIALIGYSVYSMLDLGQAQTTAVPPLPVSTPAGGTGAPQSATQPQGSLPGWLQVYFTNPDPPDVLGKGTDQVVKKDIDTALVSIDVTSFDLNNPVLVNSLVAAWKRGVNVRVVYDSDNGLHELENAATGYKLFDAILTLKAANVPMVDGTRVNGLMHDKIVIIDGKILYAGSWNLSYNDTYRNNNNLLRITDPRLIANYQGKFDEMYLSKLFGARSKYKSPNPIIQIDGVTVENYFAPEDQVMNKLIAAVRAAKSQVHYMIFTYTDTNLANAMITRAKAGVKVEGVIEARNAPQGAMVNLYCAKLPVKLDGNKYTMHHKVIIIDQETVITGSFNFTKAADDSNDDNVLIIHSPAVAALYEQEFQKMYSSGTVPNAADVKCP